MRRWMSDHARTQGDTQRIAYLHGWIDGFAGTALLVRFMTRERCVIRTAPPTLACTGGASATTVP